MDNITHSLIGITVAETSFQTLKRFHEPSTPRFRGMLWLVSFLGNNLPDLDFLFPHNDLPRNIGYLVQHRGYTHTYLLAVLQGMLLLGCFRIWCKKKNEIWSRKEWGLFAGVALSGPILHILLDSLNSYGVHPFWPLSNIWVYADTLFIIEPWIWLTLLPVIFFSLEITWARVGVFALWIAALGLVWFSGYVLMEMAFLLSLWAGFCVWIFGTKERKYGFAVLWSGFFGILLLFNQASFLAKKQIARVEARERPGVVIHDLILMPLPANPFCWGVISVESFGPVVSYRLRYGVATPFQNFIGLERCQTLEIIQRMNAQSNPKDPQIHWVIERQFEVERLKTLSEASCAVRAFLQFARAPVYEIEKNTAKLSDWRFDLRGRKNFTSLEVSPLPVGNQSCAFLPPWIPPRQDLLSSGSEEK